MISSNPKSSIVFIRVWTASNQIDFQISNPLNRTVVTITDNQQYYEASDEKKREFLSTSV